MLTNDHSGRSEVIIRMNERIRQMEGEMQSLRGELQSHRDRVLPAVKDGGYHRWLPK